MPNHRWALSIGHRSCLEPEELGAALIAGAHKVEHYEIASYATLADFAEVVLGDRAKATRHRSRRTSGRALNEPHEPLEPNNP